ncbi:SAM-dependent methyltransferase [Melioribacter roseus P3M-2]|uniref:SAM-dependent methyltransferase n=1 Tax=Melioribacter roseus (strain DSM 23840 / JCM 17771 / VKM B-2668 / P3M-2) TaxID=1191523 RepID=I6Z4W0_MELRP|nr:class I SAM-dependent methyltransferase [Melioribacter roseus]AFN74190.1 SAM-dependent methyltransferase [Melioribacter roseus P3M-2]
MKDLWDKRFSSDEYIYGIEPNEFFKSQLDKLTPGRLLLLGEGEGRNAVYAAALGWKVDAVDFSQSGKIKAERLAAEKKVTINYIVHDLSDYQPEPESYDAAGLFFLHLEEDLRKEVHKKAIDALKKGGRLIMEAFEKEQLEYDSGGPKNLSLLYSLEDIAEDFIDLDFEYFAKEIVELNEGKGHGGKASVIRFTGIKV